MKVSVPRSVDEYKAFLGRLDEVVLEKALDWGRQVYQGIVEQLDKQLLNSKGHDLREEHVRPVWYSTCLGRVRVRRRQYRARQSGHRYLLDEALGVAGRSHITPAATRLALEMSTSMSFRRSADVLSKASAVKLSHQTIWKLVGRVAEPHLQKADREIRNLLETGELPEGQGRKARCLMLEADGVMVSLQRQKAKKAEVKLGIAYEGWQQVTPKRYATVNKTIYGDLCGTDAYWAGMTLKLAQRYDLAGVGWSVLGGDGAGWVKQGCAHFGSRFQLDRYHLNREIRAVLGTYSGTITAVREHCERGETRLASQVLFDLEQKARGEQAKKIAGLRRYIEDNSAGLRDYRLDMERPDPGLRRTGAMEGNVDKLVARRMKNQGMSWSPRGIRRMLCVRFMYLEGKANEVLGTKSGWNDLPRIPAKKFRNMVDKAGALQPHIGVLETTLPALFGPHPNRPLAQVLRALAHPAGVR